MEKQEVQIYATRINNSPAVILKAESENKKRVYLFDDATSVASAVEMLKTFKAQLDNEIPVNVMGDGDNGILLSTNTEHFLFSFSDFDISTAGRLINAYIALTTVTSGDAYDE